MTPEELQAYISGQYPDLKLDKHANDLTFIVPIEKSASFFEFLKNDPKLQFDNLMCLTAVDQTQNLEVVYHLHSYSQRHRLTIKMPVGLENPKIPTVIHLWPGANWHEREAYDLYGVLFENHPDLRRILLPDDWEGFPMRKNYKHWNLTPLPDDVTEVTKEYPSTSSFTR